MQEGSAENIHISVLLDEAVGILTAGGGDSFVDATLGLGGHAEAILKELPKSRLIGIDQDTEAIVFGASVCGRTANE